MFSFFIACACIWIECFSTTDTHTASHVYIIYILRFRTFHTNAVDNEISDDVLQQYNRWYFLFVFSPLVFAGLYADDWWRKDGGGGVGTYIKKTKHSTKTFPCVHDTRKPALPRSNALFASPPLRDRLIRRYYETIYTRMYIHFINA
jgi:hypothetical protein